MTDERGERGRLQAPGHRTDNNSDLLRRAR
jgi:hypothetical protein